MSNPDVLRFLLVLSFVLVAGAKAVTLHHHIFGIFGTPVQVKLARTYLNAALGSLVSKRQSFCEGALRKNLIIGLDLRLDHNFAVNELIEACEVDLLPGKLETVGTMPVHQTITDLFYYSANLDHLRYLVIFN